MAEFTNRAALNYNNKRTVSNIIKGNMIGTIDVTKFAAGEYYFPDDSVAYVVHVFNNSDAALTNLKLTDDMGRYEKEGEFFTPLHYVEGSILYFVNDTPAGNVTPVIDAETGEMTITGINIPLGGTAEFYYRAVANEYAPMGTLDEDKIVNRVVVERTTNAVEPWAAEETIYPGTEPRLSVTKKIDHDDLTEGEEVVYTFEIQNTGLAALAAGNDLVLTDVFDPMLDITSVTLNGRALTKDTDYTYDAAGVFTTTTTAIEIPAATYVRDEDTGEYTAMPGTAILTITGTVI